MAIHLEINGPHEIKFFDKSKVAKHIDKAEKSAFLEKLENHGLSDKQGCYIFAIRTSRGFCPWYVGKTTKSMQQECMHELKINHYNAVLAKGRKGTPVMFFVVPQGNKNKVNKSICDDIETFLIQCAYEANSSIRNVQKKKVPEWTIKGVVRSPYGKKAETVKSFRNMMGL